MWLRNIIDCVHFSSTLADQVDRENSISWGFPVPKSC